MARTSIRPRFGSPLHLPGAFELFRLSRELVLTNAWIFGPLYFIPFILTLHDWLWSPTTGGGQHWADHVANFSSGWVFSPTAAYASSAFIGFDIVWLLFVIIVGTALQVMSQAAQLEAVEDQPLHFHRLWLVAKKMGWPMLQLYALSSGYIVLGLALLSSHALIGLVVLLVPAPFMLRQYLLAPYVMLDKKCGVKEAMKHSAALSHRNPASIWRVIWVMLLIALTSLIPFIGVLVAFALGALYSAAPALRYQQLKNLG